MASAGVLAGLLLAPPDAVNEYLANRPISCRPMDAKEVRDVQPGKLHAGYGDQGMARFAYTVGPHPPGEVTPKVAIRAFDGWLLGSSRGEFGGELVYRPDGGEDVLLEAVNIEDIYRMGDVFVATAGRGTIDSINGFGSVIIVGQSAGGITASSLELPGAPGSSWLVRPDALLINTLEQTVLWEAGRGLHPVRCKPGTVPDSRAPAAPIRAEPRSSPTSGRAP